MSSSELKKRLATAVVLMIAVIASVLFLPTYGVALLFAVFILAGAWEWSRFVPFTLLASRLLYVLTVCALLLGAWWLHNDNSLAMSTLVLAFAWWLFVLFWLRFPELGRGNSSLVQWGKVVSGFVALVPAWLAVLLLHRSLENGPQLLLLLLFLVWGADSGAYFAGKRWGSRRLAPQISPGKTVEGFAGGMVVSGVLGLIAAWMLGIPVGQWPVFCLICLVAAGFSVVGDLFESMMKRHRDIKDSGSLLPGHGGVLDRIDSLMAAAPIFVLELLWIGL